MITMHFKRSVLILSAFGLFACTPNSSRYGIDPSPERKAAASITESFPMPLKNSQAAGSDFTVEKSEVVIAKSALEKEFLLSSNILMQDPTPMFQSLQSRVVYFTLKNNQVFMLEASGGRSVGTNNPKTFLPLAKFEILNQTDTSLTIDFDSGMKSIITVGDMYGSDDATPNPGWTAAVVNLSYLQNVQVENNQLFIQQVAQIQKADKLVPVEIRYYLAPYNPDPNFIPTRSPGFDQVGFFEANPLLDVHGNTLNYAMKWNTNKTIQFALSANTPAEYKETIRNGALYWNRIIGENKIQVIELTDSSITAPNPNYNIIQWVNWDSAGYAYADAHVDPRSGEVTHAQVFFPSAFIQDAMEKRVRTLEGSQTPKTQIGLSGFKSAQLCRRDIYKAFNEALPLDSKDGVSKEAMNKAIKDYVFEVIAHEVGHVLGLRHNFAGNLIANYDMSQRTELALSYYKNMKAPAGIVDSSSVMEYSRFEESSWNGDMLQHGAPALAHDQVAMDFLYNNKAIPANPPLFCTDSQISKYADCNMSDAARSTVSYTVGNYDFSLQTLPVKILNQYISEAKISDTTAVPLKSVQNVLLKIDTYAHQISLDRYKLLSLLKDEVRLIQVRGPLYPIWPANKDHVLNLEKDFIASELARLGGVDQIINVKESTLDQVWIEKFKSLLDDPKYNQGLVDGKSYSFSDSEKQVMIAQFTLFSTALKNELIKNNLKALSGENISFEETYGQAKVDATKGWFDHPVTNELATAIKKVSDFYLFSKEPTKNSFQVTFQNGALNSVALPTYTYDHDVRSLAAGVWQAPHVAIDWAYLEKQQTSDELKTELSILVDADKIDFSKTNKFVLKWFLINQDLLKKIN